VEKSRNLKKIFSPRAGMYLYTMKQVITSAGAPAPIGPYSHGVLINNMLFISGQVGKDPVTGEIHNSSIEAETTRVMENLKSILTDAGMDFTHVVKTTIFLTDLNNFAKVNALYGSYFPEGAAYPARETVQVSRLPLDVNVEISMIAIKG
jgi:2-iminobutanoate/2-iminopropanoate deaminase